MRNAPADSLKSLRACPRFAQVTAALAVLVAETSPGGTPWGAVGWRRRLRASLSHWRASLENPSGVHENIHRFSGYRHPNWAGTTRGGHDGFDCRASSLITPPNFGSGVANGHDENELCLWRMVHTTIITSAVIPLLAANR